VLLFRINFVNVKLAFLQKSNLNQNQTFHYTHRITPKRVTSLRLLIFAS